MCITLTDLNAIFVYFQSMSEEFTDVVFLKVNVDENEVGVLFCFLIYIFFIFFPFLISLYNVSTCFQ